ncbi:MAG: hypothetical protein ACFNLH_07350 [Corynebacterium matruchotii]
MPPYGGNEVAVTGDPAMAAEVVTAFALELCTNSWSQDAGVWGGMSEDERRALKRRKNRGRGRARISI